MGNLNHRLRQMRKFLNKTQKEFGATGGVSQSTQNRYEKPGTDVPLSYLDRIFEEYGADFNENWFYFGKGEMLLGNSQKDQIKSPDNQEFKGLSPEESRIVAEVGQFSKFLKNRPLRPEVKRRLLQLLIASIDQALEELRDNDPETD